MWIGLTPLPGVTCHHEVKSGKIVQWNGGYICSLGNRYTFIKHVPKRVCLLGKFFAVVEHLRWVIVIMMPHWCDYRAKFPNSFQLLFRRVDYMGQHPTPVTDADFVVCLFQSPESQFQGLIAGSHNTAGKTHS